MQFKVPQRDIRFLMYDVFDYESHYKKLTGGDDVSRDLVDAIMEECAKLSEQVIFPLYQSGDAEGCTLADGKVTTPKGFKEAYDHYVAGGWQGLSHPAEYGGQGLPLSLGLMKSEMISTANWSWGMYPGLSLGAMNTIFKHGTEDQKQTYLTPLCEGRWAGTMGLTEPQCGTDLGQVKTRATPQADGSYRIDGTKIFISSGDHDLTENIVHIVLARLPDAPAGTRGISLFIVPKFQVNADGSLGAFNNVNVGALEHKMGIKASATCVLNFDGAVGFLIGPPNKGLECMFTFMNTARIGTGLQGIASAELSYQNALAYAKERRSMRALSGKKEPDQVADAIIYHGDVRRMLLTQKAFAEGGRALLYFAAKFADKMVAGVNDPKEWDHWDDKLGFFTPILKGCMTEFGQEAASLGMQVYGGHGYIKEWGMEQIARDARISTLYEGTTGVQALDLLGRKVLLMTRGKAVREFTGYIANFCTKALKSPHRADMLKYVWALSKYTAQWNYLTMRIMLQARKEREFVGTASVDFLMFSGYVTLAYFWARMAFTSLEKLASGDGVETPEFYQAKLQTAEFFFERLLPRAAAHAEMALAPSKSIMQMDNDHFAFN